MYYDAHDQFIVTLLWSYTCLRLLITLEFSLPPTSDNTFSIFSFTFISLQLTFHILGPLPGLSFHSSQNSSSHIFNLPSTNKAEIWGHEDRLSVHPSRLENVEKDVSCSHLIFCQPNYEEVFICNDEMKEQTLLLLMFASAIEKNSQSPCTSWTTSTALEWWTFYFHMMSFQEGLDGPHIG